MARLSRIQVVVFLLLALCNSVARSAEVDVPPALPALRPVFDYPVRDTCVCLGLDGNYYLTGTTGHPTWWQTNEGIRLWKSKDLV